MDRLIVARKLDSLRRCLDRVRERSDTFVHTRITNGLRTGEHVLC